MTPSRRLVVAVVASLALSAPTAALVCVPLGLGTAWFAVTSMAAGPAWASVAAWSIDKTEAARKRLQGAPSASYARESRIPGQPDTRTQP